VRPIRVLIVDDSVVSRRVLSEAIAAAPGLEVAGTAANGRIALAKLAQVAPDVVVLDVDMPEMGGLETLVAIRRRSATLPVIMCSALTERGAVATFDALARDANDYWTKPSGERSAAEAAARITEELVPKIRLWAARRLPVPVGAASPVGPSSSARAPDARVEVVAIGVSTGGPNALARLLPALPADLPVPIVIVQHMPPLFTRTFAERLAKQCTIDVHEAAGGERLEAGTAWVAPGDQHMVVDGSAAMIRLRLHQDPPVNFCRPAVDVLFQSAAEVYGAHALGIILTGMGSDGVTGCRRIRAAGGAILVQDEATSVVWGMPRLVAGAGLADAVLPLDEIASEIVRRVQLGRAPLADTPAAAAAERRR
jgi:two-component system, chemotaxis family, protein-glutamate methylesterase/glutaminase